MKKTSISKALLLGGTAIPAYLGYNKIYDDYLEKQQRHLVHKRDEPEQERYRKYFEQLRQAPHTSLGERVVTAATSFVEKRASLQAGQTKTALLEKLKALVSPAAREAQLIAKLTDAAKRVQAVSSATGLQPEMITSIQQAAQARSSEGLLSKLLSSKGILIGGGLLGLGAISEPALQRIGFMGRAQLPGMEGWQGLPERVRMDEVAAENFAKSVGSELGKSTVGLAGDILSRTFDTATGLPGQIMQQQQRQSIFDSLRAEDDVIAKADPQQLNDAYHTMVRFAPTLATDKNAVKTFLRESTLYGTGPNFMSIKQLADAEESVTAPEYPSHY